MWGILILLEVAAARPGVVPAGAAAVDAAAEPVVEAARPHRAPEDWLAAIDARMGTVPGLRWAARRSTERADTRLVERWRFAWDGGERFRIDYFGDTARQVACDGRALVDYVPANERAQRFDLEALPADRRNLLLAQVLGKVMVPGLRPGGTSDLDWRLAGEAPHDGRPAVTLDGYDGGERRLRYVVDAERLALLRSEAWDGGTTALRTVARGHSEVAPGLWLPARVEVWTPEARIEVDLSRYEVLDDPSPALFQLVLDPGVAVDARP